jgi:hypothetical protein
MDDLIISIGKEIVKKRKKSLQDHEKRYIMQRLSKLDLNLFKGKPINRIISKLTELITNELGKLPKLEEEGPIDVHEMLKKEIGREPETSLMEKKLEEHVTVDSLLQNPAVLQSIFNPKALRRKAYLILDRKFQAKDTNNINEFKWHISNTSKAYNPLTTAATTAPMRDIVKIKMFPFRFPNSTDTITESHRLSVEIVELNTQAYIITHINKKFHFVFDIEPTSSGNTEPYNITDVGNSLAEFEFHDPIVELNTITIRFGNPEALIHLDPDSLYGTISALGAQTLITFTQPHFCSLSTTVVISDFNTTNPLADASEIAIMNDPTGWEIVAMTSLTITINVDISGLNGAIVGNPFYIYLNAKRFVLRMELTYITNN